MIYPITDSNFTETLKKNGCLVVVYFYMEHCGFCKLVEPILKSLSETYGDRVLFLSMDMDRNQLVPKTLKVEHAPIILLIKNSTIVDKKMGYKETFREEMTELINKHVA